MAEGAPRRQRRDHVAFLDGAAVDAADEGAHVGGAAAREYRNVDASCHGQVGAGSSARAPEGYGVAGSDANRLPHRQWRVVEHRREIGPSDGDHRLGEHPQLQAGEEHLEPCTARSSAHQITLAGIVPDEQVAHAQGEPICRTGWGHSRSEVSRAANILNRRLGTAVEHFEHHALYPRSAVVARGPASHRPGRLLDPVAALDGEFVHVVLEPVAALLDLILISARLVLPPDLPVGDLVDGHVGVAIADPRQHGTVTKDRALLLGIIELDGRSAKQLIASRTPHRIEGGQLACLTEYPLRCPLPRPGILRGRDAEGRIQRKCLVAGGLEPDSAYPPLGGGMRPNDVPDRRMVDLCHVLEVVGSAMGFRALLGPRIVVPDRDRDVPGGQLSDLTHPLFDLFELTNQPLARRDKWVIHDTQRTIRRDRLGDPGNICRPEGGVECDDPKVEQEIELVAELDRQIQVTERTIDRFTIEHHWRRRLFRSEYVSNTRYAPTTAKDKSVVNVPSA